MKRIGNVWETFVSMRVLEQAARKSCAARRDKAEVAAFLARKDELLADLQRSLMDGTYHTSEYRLFTIREHGKERLIADLPLYPDRIVHWAVALAVEEPLDRKLIGQTYGSRKGGGHHKAVGMLRTYLRRDARIRYALQMDVRHFFQSIDKGVLRERLRRVVKDARMLEMLDRIIVEYPYDGIPLGNRTSPILANLYLSDLDHLLKEGCHCHYFLRYMDDMVVLGYSKPWLHRIRRRVSEMLEGIGLELKGDWRVFPVSCGITFLGYVVYRTHTRLRRRTKDKMKRAVRRLDGRPPDPSSMGTVMSYAGVLGWCDGRNLFKKVLLPVLVRWSEGAPSPPSQEHI